MRDIIYNSNIRASVLSMLNVFIKMVVSLVTVPITIKCFGSEMYGVWAAALSIMTFVNFLDAGLTPTILNKLSIAFSNKDKKAFKESYIMGVYVGIIVLIITFIFTILLGKINFTSILNLSYKIDNIEVVRLFQIVLITTGLVISTSIFENIYFSINRGDIPRIISIIFNILGLILIVFISKFNKSILILALAIQLPKFIYRFILAIYIYKFTDVKLLPFQKINIKYVKELFNTSSKFVFIQVFNWLYSSAASFIIPRQIGLQEFTDFTILFTPFNIILTIIASFQPIFWPKFLESFHYGKFKDLKNYMYNNIKFSSIFLMFFIIIYMLFGPIFIKIYSNNSVSFNYLISINFSIWLLIQSQIWWLSTFFHGIQDLIFEIISFGLSALSLITISYLFGNELNINRYSVIMWTSIVIFNLIPMYIRFNNKLDIRNEKG
ncbi:oligosaccharide flippase family protein [Clostridium perfringens]|uniref:lipopolysaccharide biosynthesis protein n=1 Tax=Clostridium perfringens TaxID=1502 RepID=UPI001CCFAE74|nr:oligosaccharide flippase family protein [Clostridium perfringens]UBK78244.1 oligosaccharide flippase family protein [Clostridium perfringens]